MFVHVYSFHAQFCFLLLLLFFFFGGGGSKLRSISTLLNNCKSNVTYDVCGERLCKSHLFVKNEGMKQHN